MGTDLEAFIKLYKQFGINCEVGKLANGNQVIIFGAKDGEEGYIFDAVTISEKIKSDYPYYTEIVFNPNGEFVEQGIY